MKWLALVLLAPALSLAAPKGASYILPRKAPFPKENKLGRNKLALGKSLFFDSRLSPKGDVSCNTCHNVMRGGMDNRRVSTLDGDKLERNTPTLYNVGFMSAFYWDGRAVKLEEVTSDPKKLGGDKWEPIIERLKKIPGYRAMFNRTFGLTRPFTGENIGKALATYIRTLVTPAADFDRYMRGNKAAIPTRAKRGWEAFKRIGCLTCHSGPNFAGPNLPAGQPYLMKFPKFEGTDYESDYDLDDDDGREEFTDKDEDEHHWRVPTLRNIALTAPYFHNGSVKTLTEAVKVMAKTQLDKELNDAEVRQIVAFLKTLNGKAPKQSVPSLPAAPGETVVDDD